MVLGSNRELVVREVTQELWEISNLWPSSTELFPPDLATSGPKETNPKHPHSRASDPAASDWGANNLGINNLGTNGLGTNGLDTPDANPNVLQGASFDSGLKASGLKALGLDASQLETLTVTVETGESRLNLRLLPPIGSAARRQLDYILNSLRQQAQLAQRLGDKKRGKLLWRRFFLIRDSFASLGPAAVLTVHRAQGSTFAEVFVADDLFWPRENLLRRQLAYVAVSRASQAVVMLAAEGSQADQRQWRQWLNIDHN
jgi:hypothetical protein